jgi:hypothetical protein
MTIARHGITEATNGVPIISRAVVCGDLETHGSEATDLLHSFLVRKVVSDKE